MLLAESILAPLKGKWQIFDATVESVLAPLKGELARAERATEGSLTMCAHSGRGLPRRCSATLVYSAARNLRLRGDPAAQDDATLLSRYAGWRAFGAPTSFLSSLEKKETRGGRVSPAEESDFIGISSDASSRGGLHSICYADRLFPRLKENSFDKIG